MWAWSVVKIGGMESAGEGRVLVKMRGQMSCNGTAIISIIISISID